MTIDTAAVRVLSLNDLVLLGEIARAAAGCRRVRRLIDGDRLVEGTARSIGDERGNFLASGEDVRDGYLRVTLTSGLEAFWPVMDLVAAMNAGELAID